MVPVASVRIVGFIAVAVIIATGGVSSARTGCRSIVYLIRFAYIGTVRQERTVLAEVILLVIIAPSLPCYGVVDDDICYHTRAVLVECLYQFIQSLLRAKVAVEAAVVGRQIAHSAR